MTFGSGAVQSLSWKQKLNTRSSTEAKLVAAADASTLIFWTQQFLEAQGYAVERSFLYQDNKLPFCWRQTVSGVRPSVR